jgi:hypothetical protein
MFGKMISSDPENRYLDRLLFNPEECLYEQKL